MKVTNKVFWASACPLVAGFWLAMFAQVAFAASTIQGTVYDKQRNALPDIEVELLDDVYRQVGRTRTDGAGRYHFYSLSDGRYTVKVYAFRYDLQDQDFLVEIVTQNIRGGEGTGFFQQDFYLQPKKGGLADTELGVVYAQEVPKDAERAYQMALKDFSAKRTNEGISGLNEAIRLYPSYYLALHRMGKELFVVKKFGEAVPFLLRAGEVNSKSATTFYYLGYSLHNLGKEYNKAALTALLNAHVMAPSSMQVLYVLGKVERSEGKYLESEKHLLQAKKLSKVSIPEIHKELAQLYADNLKRYKEAADELEAYLKASNMDSAATAQTKKVINGLRDKARSQINTN